MHRHGIHNSVLRQSKRATYGKFGEQFEDKGRNQLHRSITEGGSGLYKTARTIYYNLKSNFRYEYLINENEFEIKVNFEV